jgi:hypothetical protein
MRYGASPHRYQTTTPNDAGQTQRLLGAVLTPESALIFQNDPEAKRGFVGSVLPNPHWHDTFNVMAEAPSAERDALVGQVRVLKDEAGAVTGACVTAPKTGTPDNPEVCVDQQGKPIAKPPRRRL